MVKIERERLKKEEKNDKIAIVTKPARQTTVVIYCDIGSKRLAELIEISKRLYH